MRFEIKKRFGVSYVLAAAIVAASVILAVLFASPLSSGVQDAAPTSVEEEDENRIVLVEGRRANATAFCLYIWWYSI